MGEGGWGEESLAKLGRVDSESVDLVYLRPPLSPRADSLSEAEWTWADVEVAFLEGLFLRCPRLAGWIRAVGAAHGRAMMAYVAFVALRGGEAHRVLKSSGTLYLHCSASVGHYFKAMLDAVFGGRQFVCEIVRAGGGAEEEGHEVLLVFAKRYGAHFYRAQFLPYGERYVREWFRHRDEDGRAYRTRSRAGRIVRQYLDESAGVPLSSVWRDVGTAQALAARILTASSREGEAVLAPFGDGAGFGEAAARLGRRWGGEVAGRRSDGGAAVVEEGAVRRRLFAGQGGKCNGCGGGRAFEVLEVDWVVSREWGGGGENYQLLCGDCHALKRRRPMAYLRNRLRYLEERLGEEGGVGE